MHVLDSEAVVALKGDKASQRDDHRGLCRCQSRGKHISHGRAHELPKTGSMTTDMYTSMADMTATVQQSSFPDESTSVRILPTHFKLHSRYSTATVHIL